MATSIGKLSKSFFIKLLVGIIILPFVFWGMGDVFRGGNQNVIATVDSNKISTQEFINYDETLGGTCLSIGECMPGVDDCINGLGPDATCPESLDIDGDGILSFCACPDVDNDGLIFTQNIEIPIGARKYEDCAGLSQCDVPVFGYDGECYSAGYLKDGQIPFFKIYDFSRFTQQIKCLFSYISGFNINFYKLVFYTWI